MDKSIPCQPMDGPKGLVCCMFERCGQEPGIYLTPDIYIDAP